ncbi:Hypothetical protein PENO1_111780 [Penicillium occitanis (nom. inval.)]|nr:Hypothetical protein PENO1_111780 [Penicillium occitanis (nom. inval.)]
MESQPPDESISALFVRRCVYFAFFGRPSETPPTSIDEDHSTRRSSPHPPLSPLFVPEEHNPLDDHPVTGIVDHEIDRPDPQHRDSRREERRQRRRQERETRRRQKQERRRQRESRRQQRSSNGGQEDGPAARSHSVAQSHAESSRGSSGNITEVEIDAGNQHEPTQPENTVEEDLAGNALTTDHTPVDPLIAEPIQTETPLGQDHHEAEMEDHIVAPEIIINEPSPEHVPDHTEDNARLNGSTEANAPPREVDEGEALIPQEDDHLADIPSRHLMESHHATLGSSRQRRAVRRSRPLGLKRPAIARRQAAARTRLGGKHHRLTQVDVKRGHKFTPDANLGVEKLPPTEDLTVQSPLEEVVAEERAQTLAHLEERPAISESAVADPANPSPSPLLPSIPELIARLRESESPVEGNHGDETGNPPPENPHEDLRQERSERPSLEAARPELLTEDRESRRKVPRDKKIAEEARRRQEAKQRAENTPRAAQESENDFTQTRSGDDLLNDDDDGELAPLEGNHAAAAAGENQRPPSTSSPSQPLKAGRKQFARHARQGPYRRPIEKGQGDRDRPLTQINMQLTASDQPTIAPGDPPLPTIPLIEQPPTENPPNTLPVPPPHDRSVDRRRKAANMIRERRPPVLASPHDPSKDLVIFRVWTGTRWTERTRVVADPSDPLRCEREAKRFVETYHAQLRDAQLRILMPSQCLQSARQDGSQSVFLIFPEDRTVTDAMEKAAAAFMSSRRHRH